MHTFEKACRKLLIFSVFSVALLSMVVSSLWAAQRDFFEVKMALETYKTQNGIAPNDEFFFSLIFDPKYNLTDVEQFHLWDELVEMQSPKITKDDLRSIVLAKRNSIKDFYCEFTVIRENTRTNNDPAIGVTNYKYSYKNNLFFVERERRNDRSRISFSGEHFIKVWFSPGLQANILHPPESLHDGFVPMMPLFQSMIADTNLYHSDHQGFDFIYLMDQNKNLGIFDKKEVIDGREYLVLGNFTRRLLLDIDKDFSVYQSSQYSYLFQNNPSKPRRIIGRSKASERTLLDMTDYGNGIWLPKKSENLYITERTGEVTMSDIVTYNNIKLNQGLEDDFFIDVIPEDALVTDSIRDMVYLWSDRASINGLLQSTVKATPGSSNTSA